MIDKDRLQKQSGIIGTSNGIDQVLEMICQVSPLIYQFLLQGSQARVRSGSKSNT